MPVTWNKVSKAQKSKEADMISDSENLDVMVVSNHFESENSEFGFLLGGLKVLVMTTWLITILTRTQTQEIMKSDDLPGTAKTLLK